MLLGLTFTEAASSACIGAGLGPAGRAGGIGGGAGPGRSSGSRSALAARSVPCSFDSRDDPLAVGRMSSW